jgi:putative phosphoesterase
MRIAILSDTHSRGDTVRAALALLEGRGAELLLHCGDIEDADTVWLFPPNTHFVYGNCDGDRDGIREAVRGVGAQLYDPFGSLELGGVKLAWAHGDDTRVLRELQECGHYDYVFHGHTHVAVDRHVGRTRVINPGALYRARPKTFALLDLTTGELETLTVE